MASTVPSPPSAIGIVVNSTLGTTVSMPFCTAAAISILEALPLKESMAKTTFFVILIVSYSLPIF